MVRTLKIGRKYQGFSLIELLVVLAILGALVAIATPMVTGALQRGREVALQQNLGVMRKLIDDFTADRGEHPTSLETLVQEGYMRAVPPDSVANNQRVWAEVKAEDGGLADIHSTSDGTGQNGVPYAQW